jgi:hypothetical protein
MSTSEQEVQSQVAEMRQALRSAAASRRTAKLVNILAVFVGLCMVGFFVWQIMSMGKSLIDNPEALQSEVTKQVELLNIQQKATEIVEKAAPAYAKQVEEIFLNDKELQQAVGAELEAALKDLEPVVRRELAVIWPRAQRMLERQADKTLDTVQDTLQRELSTRLATIMEDKTGQLAGQADLSPEQLAEVAQALQEGLAGAVAIVWRERTGELEQEMDAINDLLIQIPERDPQLTAEETYNDIMRVLVAILREELPPYDTSKLMFAPVGAAPGSGRGPAGPPGVGGEAATEAATEGAAAAAAVQEAIDAAVQEAVQKQQAREAAEGEAQAAEAAEAAEGGQR